MDIMAIIVSGCGYLLALLLFLVFTSLADGSLRCDFSRCFKLAPFGRTIRPARRTPWYPHYIRDIPPWA